MILGIQQFVAFYCNLRCAGVYARVNFSDFCQNFFVTINRSWISSKYNRYTGKVYVKHTNKNTNYLDLQFFLYKYTSYHILYIDTYTSATDQAFQKCDRKDHHGKVSHLSRKLYRNQLQKLPGQKLYQPLHIFDKGSMNKSFWNIQTFPFQSWKIALFYHMHLNYRMNPLILCSVLSCSLFLKQTFCWMLNQPIGSKM